MTLLLLGADGQLGRMLRRTLGSAGPVLALGRRGEGVLAGDLLDPAGLANTIRAVRPRFIVNAAAWTAVDRAEADPEGAYAVNATACEVLAREAEALGAWLVHFSTDYVFDGTGTRPWRESDAPDPMNIYGASKLAGERAIAAACRRHLIFRTSWVFETQGANFVRAILEAARVRPRLEVVGDQWGAPSRANWLAEVTARLLPGLEERHAGVYHLAPSGFTSRHGLAVHLVQRALLQGASLRCGPEAIESVPTVPKAGVARRPLNSRLDTSRFRATFGVECPPWQPGVDQVVDELVSGWAPEHPL